MIPQIMPASEFDAENSDETTRPPSILQRVKLGLVMPFRGLCRLAKTPSLRRLAFVPAIINLGLFIGLLFFLVEYLHVAVQWLWDKPGIEVWYQVFALGLWYLLYGLSIAAAVVASYFVSIIIGGVLASPFHDLLSSRVESLADANLDNTGEDAKSLWGLLKGMINPIVVLGLYGLTIALILPINLVPAIGSFLATAAMFGVSAFFISFEYMDATLDRHGMGLRQKLNVIYENWLICLSFGMGLSMMFWVPVLNILVMPVAVVGGTLLAIQLLNKRP